VDVDGRYLPMILENASYWQILLQKHFAGSGAQH
jgi:hypothetical protein